MAHKYPNILIHLVFSTKERRDPIPRVVMEISRRHRTQSQDPSFLCGGTTNHVHPLIALPSDVTVAKAVQVLKANSSRWMGEHGIAFAWQEGYGAFSVSASHVPAVRRYIDHQAEHHAKRTYEDEFLTLLKKTGVGFDRYCALPGTAVPGFRIPPLRG